MRRPCYRDAALSVERRQLAITTARAAAAAPITVDEIIDAVHNLDSDVVRSWIVASDQQFDLDGQQVALLAHAGLPAPVMQAIVGARMSQMAMPGDSMRGADAYSNYPSNNQGYATQPYQPMTTIPVSAGRCPSSNPYSAYNGDGYSPSTLSGSAYPL